MVLFYHRKGILLNYPSAFVLHSKVNILALRTDAQLCRQDPSLNEFTLSARMASGNFAAQRAAYAYEQKGSGSGQKGAVVIVLKSARTPK